MAFHCPQNKMQTLPTVYKALPTFAGCSTCISDASLLGSFNSSPTGLLPIPSLGKHLSHLNGLVIITCTYYALLLDWPFSLFKSQLRCHLLEEAFLWAPHLLRPILYPTQQAFPISLPCLFFSSLKLLCFVLSRLPHRQQGSRKPELSCHVCCFPGIPTKPSQCYIFTEWIDS